MVLKRFSRALTGPQTIPAACREGAPEARLTSCYYKEVVDSKGRAVPRSGAALCHQTSSYGSSAVNSLMFQCVTVGTL